MRVATRAAAGPLMIGIAVWCASGIVSVTNETAAAGRVVVPAAVWILAVATGAGFCVGRWRREPLTAAPALFATLPWWPVPMPAAALVWTGHLAWVPIVMALGLAWWPRPGARHPRALPALSGLPRAPVIAATLTLLVAGAAAIALHGRLPGGDEPHYLVITQSLLGDGDLRIENNHQQGDYRAYFPGDLRPDFIARSRDGAIYSIHAPGTSALVLPGFAMGGYRGAQITIALVAAVTGALIWILGWMATRDRAAAWFGWAAVTLSTTFVLQSVMVFPDMPGALGTAAGLLLLMRLGPPPGERDVRLGVIVGVSALLAALPWFHTRFVVIAVAIAVLVCWQLLRDESRPLRTRVRRVCMFGAAPALSALAWFGFFVAVYGTPNPAAPYGPNPETSLRYVPGGMAALLFDQQFGLVAYAPVLAAGALALVLRRQGARRPLGSGLVVILVYLATVGTYWMWYAGVPATPARFATAVLPAFAAPVAFAWHRLGTGGRTAVAWLLVASIAFTTIVLVAGEGGLAWNVRFAETQWVAWIGSTADLSRAMPSFFWRLTPGEVVTEWHFAWHLGLWLAVWATLLTLASRLAAPRRTDHATAFVTLALPAAFMVACAVGWRVNGVTGLDPASSQLAVLRASDAGARVFSISGMRVARLPSTALALRIPVLRPNGLLPAELPVGALPGVPAGLYELTVTTRRSAPARLTVRADRGGEPLAVIDLGQQTSRSGTFSVPSGPTTVVFEPDGGLRKSGLGVAIVRRSGVTARQ